VCLCAANYGHFHRFAIFHFHFFFQQEQSRDDVSTIDSNNQGNNALDK
jgi:hypothetical protein